MKQEQSNNRPKSKNNPYGKKGEVSIDWNKYYERRRAEGANRNELMSEIADKACELMGLEKGSRDRRVSAILVSVTKSYTRLSYIGLENYFERHPDEREICRLKRAYKKSWYQLRVSEIDQHVMQKIVAWMGRDDAKKKTLAADSTGFSVSRRKEWINAKYGKLDVKDFDKMHIIQALNGKICAVAITDGSTNDSPVLRDLLQFLPQGSGADVLWVDAAYANKMNCAAVVETGSPMMPKANSVARGYNAYADILRFCDEHPGTFYRKLAKRNNIESAFSAIKARFGGAVRAIKRPNRAIELMSMAICYNMTV